MSRALAKIHEIGLNAKTEQRIIWMMQRFEGVHIVASERLPDSAY